MMPEVFLIKNGQIVDGPWDLRSPEVRKLTNCGNPERLPDLSIFGLAEAEEAPRTSSQTKGTPKLQNGKVIVPAVERPVSIPDEVPVQFIKLALLQFTPLGLSTVEQLNSTILSTIQTAFPPGMSREAAKLWWESAAVFRKTSPILLVLWKELPKVKAKDLDTIFLAADQLYYASLL